MQQTPEVSFPSTNLEVEIVLTIAFGGSVLKAASRYIGILLGESVKRMRDDDQATYQETSQIVVDLHHASFHSFSRFC